MKFKINQEKQDIYNLLQTVHCSSIYVPIDYNQHGENKNWGDMYWSPTSPIQAYPPQNRWNQEDWEGIILVQGMPGINNNNKGYVCCYHQGFTTWHQLLLLANNGGSEILCSPRSRDFWHGPLRYASLFFIPICFP